MLNSNAGVGSNCGAEVEQCKAAAGVLQAMLHNDFQQPDRAFVTRGEYMLRLGL
jgi:hypothetical protein